MRTTVLLTGLLASANPAHAQDPISLTELAEIARERFEQDQPQQLEALKPFEQDLEMTFNADNEPYLRQRFALAAELGDGIVPTLLQKLTPWDEGNVTARNTAENSARLLLLLDPSGFVAPLIDVANGPSYLARMHAIALLGHSRSAVARRYLIDQLDKLHGAPRVATVDALRELRALEPAARIADFLRTQDGRLRRAAIDYLTATEATSALPAVLQALAEEEDATPVLLPGYVSYIEAAARGDADAAMALLRFTDPATTPPAQVEAVCRALAVVAPAGHRPTLDACRRILTNEHTDSLGLTAALTMAALGVNDGLNVLLSALKEKIRREPRTSIHYRHRGDVHRAMAQWDRASRDYLDAIERSDNWSLKRRLYLLVARCEAHRDRASAVLKALKDSRETYATIMAEADQDEALRAMLDQQSIRRYLDTLPRRGGPGR